jgi:uncharacterized sulfatase
MFPRLASLFAVIFVFAGSALAAAPPNIVLIISDDQAWGDYGFMGHPHIRTPNLDRLAAQSLVFPRGYVPSSLCCPSLASIITGRYPHQHGITSNDPTVPGDVKPKDKSKAAEFRDGRHTMNGFMEKAATLPRVLAAHGYLSFQTGKWWQGNFATGGFTHGMSVGDEDHGGRHGDAGLKIGRETMQPIFDFIGTAQEEKKPFLVWYAPMLPHDPHNAPDRILEKYKAVAPSLHVARYWANIEWFDETVGQLLEHLDKQGLAENTIVAFVADNGWIQDPESPKFAAKSKQSPYDGGLRTPIMLRWPGKIAPRKSEALATSLDFYPTLLTALGLKPAADLPGLNLLDGTALAKRQQLFGECYTHDAKDLANPAASLRWRWMIDGHTKLIVPAAQNEPTEKTELYDLAADPNEERSLAASQADRVAELSQKLDAWWPGAK